MNLDDESLVLTADDMPVMRGSKMNVDMVPHEPDYVPELPDYLQGQQMPPELSSGPGGPMPF